LVFIYTSGFSTRLAWTKRRDYYNFGTNAFVLIDRTIKMRVEEIDYSLTCLLQSCVNKSFKYKQQEYLTPQYSPYNHAILRTSHTILLPLFSPFSSPHLPCISSPPLPLFSLLSPRNKHHGESAGIPEYSKRLDKPSDGGARHGDDS